MHPLKASMVLLALPLLVVGTPLLLHALSVLALLALIAACFAALRLSGIADVDALVVAAQLIVRTTEAAADSESLAALITADALRGIRANLVLGAAVTATVGLISRTVLTTLAVHAGPVIGAADAAAAEGLGRVAAGDTVLPRTAGLVLRAARGVRAPTAADLIPGTAVITTLRVRWRTADAGIGCRLASTARFTRVRRIRRVWRNGAASIHTGCVRPAT